MPVRLKRVYEPRSDEDGSRILVDGLWPRGLSRDKAGIDVWLRAIAPSPGLRRWFGHDPEKWAEFQRLYRDELKKNDAAVAILRERVKAGPMTLLYGARDTEHNHAIVLRDYLTE